MPSPNRLKIYVRGAYYHIYNRGVAKQDVFLDKNDQRTFENSLEKQKLYIEVVTHCLMPNHYHLLALNKTERGIEKALHSLGTTYSMYFNKKYHRVGPLFQDRYKARILYSYSEICVIKEYIYLNSIKAGPS